MAEMSLILDALKKSESERQRERAPGLQTIHQPLPRAVPRVRSQRWIIGAVVVVNVAVLAAYWRWQQPGAAALATATDESVSATDDVKPASADPAIGSAVTSNAVQQKQEAEFAQISPASTPEARSAVATSLPVEEVGDLPADVRNNLPAMTFSFHVYSSNSQNRTIIINNRRMREGDEIDSDLLLQEITEDGVILLHSGHRIHISVLSGW